MSDSDAVLSPLEDEIVTILVEGEYYDFGGDLDDVTSESCREALSSYCERDGKTFLWEDQRAVEKLLSGFLRHSDLDCSLIAAACKTAWSQVSWGKVSAAVVEFLKEEAS